MSGIHNNNTHVVRFEECYDVRDLLGSGTCGEVRRAIHRQSGKVVAVKIIPTQGGFRHPTTATTTGFQAEAQMLQQLNHPYIVQLLDVYVQPPTVYLVMELLHGGDLLDRILLKGRYSETDSRRVMRRLFAAVHYLHETCNVVHRDLKPENILCVSKENDILIKLTDFGLAKSMTQEVHLGFYFVCYRFKIGGKIVVSTDFLFC
jgi:serine/threonine protein kinase